jgi:hypothetical protein
MSLPPGYWKSVDRQRELFDWMEKQLNIVSKEDWYKVSSEDVEQKGGSAVLNRYSSLQKALSSVSSVHGEGDRIGLLTNNDIS